jgi:uncharacterized protein YndB with AHSA1/START domain
LTKETIMTAATDLRLGVETYIAAPPETVWDVMTRRMAEWWCPAPWRAEVIAQDWCPGGRAAMLFHGPDGEQMPQEGIFLEVTPGVRFVSTDAFTAGWRPAGPMMVGTWEIEAEGTGTRYRAFARHWTQESHDQHRDMGFEAGWGAAAQQLKALCEAAD